MLDDDDISKWTKSCETLNSGHVERVVFVFEKRLVVASAWDPESKVFTWMDLMSRDDVEMPQDFRRSVRFVKAYKFPEESEEDDDGELY